MERRGARGLRGVVVIGGGFGGLAVAKALKGAAVETVLVDRTNHHVFQPLLYQVATASLSPADISGPIRGALRGVKNCDVVLAEAIGVDTDAKEVVFEAGRLAYDYLVLAAGVTHDYFGHDEWADLAPGLKTLEDATELRRRLLLAFESAEYETDPEARRAMLTFAVVGGGPTGVELSGAIREIAGQTLPDEYRHIETASARVILFEGGDRVLKSFPDGLSTKAQRDLENLGVEVRLNTRVTELTEEGVMVGEEFVPARNVFWAAGVKASPLGKDLGAEVDRAGRVVVGGDLSIAGHREVFAIGDVASVRMGDGGTVPGVAQGALQMGRYVGKVIADEVRAKAGRAGEGSGGRAPFVYKDKGSMAIIGKNRAVVAMGSTRLSGFVAWVLWAVVHIAFLVGFRNRLRVLAGWFWGWLVNSRDARLIVGESRLRVKDARGPGFTPTGEVQGAGGPTSGAVVASSANQSASA